MITAFRPSCIWLKDLHIQSHFTTFKKPS